MISSGGVPRRNARRIGIAGVVITLVLGCGLVGRDSDAQDGDRPVTPRTGLYPEEQHLIEVFREASASVVHVINIGMRRDIFSLNVTEIPQGAGTGFIWDELGHVVTNFHVLMGGTRFQVTLADGSVWDAEVVGAAQEKDLAVLRIDAPRDVLRPIAIGSSSDLQVGQHVLAIGNPFGLDQTLTTGVISGLGREIQSVSRHPIQGVIQTDAAINPGNSGGPLLDSAGRVIGVNTAIYSPSGAYAGVGFAVPVDTVVRIIPQLIRYQKVVRPGLGVNIAEDQQTRRLGLDGVLVLQVVEGGAAHRAGIRPTRRDREGRWQLGDVIVAVDDRKIENTSDLYRVLDNHEVGDEVELKLRRGTAEQNVHVRLQALEN